MRARPDQDISTPHRIVPVQQTRFSPPIATHSLIPVQTIRPWTLPPQQPYILENINIVDSLSGTILPNRTVYITAGKIISITPNTNSSSSTSHDKGTISNNQHHHNYYHGEKETEPEPEPELEEAAIHIPCTGKFLSPGLIDAHVHLTSVPGEPDLRAGMAVTPPVSFLRQPFQARAMLERGYTTVRDCGGASLALKEAIAEGVFPGPRLFIAGHGLSQTGGHGDRRGAYDPAVGGGGSSSGSSICGCNGGGGLEGGLSQVVDGVPDVLRAAREQLRQGADFLKIMVGGGVASPTDKLSGVQFTAEEIRAAADVAEGAETFVTAHAYTARAIRRAVENGVRGIEHGNFLDPPTARLLAARGVFLTPTLVTYHAMADPKYAAFLPAENRAKNEMVLREGLRSLRVAYEAGVTMCLGSDLLSFLGVEQLGEFGLRAQVLEGKEVLKHATVNPAKMLGQEQALGQVREGFVADLLILNANPLDDITVFERPEEHLLAVIKEGRVYNSRWSKLPVDVYPKTRLLE